MLMTVSETMVYTAGQVINVSRGIFRLKAKQHLKTVISCLLSGNLLKKSMRKIYKIMCQNKQCEYIFCGFTFARTDVFRTH